MPKISWLKIICSIIVAFYGLEPIVDNYYILEDFIVHRFSGENFNLNIKYLWVTLGGLKYRATLILDKSDNWLFLYLAIIAFLACQFKSLSSTIFRIILPIFIFDTAYQLAPLNLQPITIHSIFKWKTADSVVSLKEQPFFVFRPNTRITSRGERGDDFTNSWMSDSLGFKNITQNNDFDWVAIGDSFTEGMGTRIKESWPNILNSQGIPTYNLGVQGYAPSQSVATLNYASKKGLKFKGIIVGYLPKIYPREGRLEGLRLSPGGMGSIQAYEASRSRMLSKEILKAIIRIIRARLRQKEPKISYTSDGIPSEYLKNINIRPYHIGWDFKKEKNAGYRVLIKQYAKAIKFARSNQKEIFFVILPHRLELLGHAIAKDTDYFCNTDLVFEYNIIEPWLTKKGVTILDLSLPVYKKVKAWYLNPEKNLQPYFKLDGHLNPTGNKIVADTVEAFIKSGHKPKSMIESLCPLKKI